MDWWAVIGKPNSAHRAYRQIVSGGHDALFPVERVSRRRRVPGTPNKYEIVNTMSPVFGRYFFARGDVRDILSYSSVAGVVRSGGNVLPVPERVVRVLRSNTKFSEGVGDVMGPREVSKMRLGFCGSVGDTFRFAGGPLEGFVGLITSLDKLATDNEVSVCVDMLGSRQIVQVEKSLVGPIIGVSGDVEIRGSKRQVKLAA
jgi:transcription antitermination factor NusG